MQQQEVLYVRFSGGRGSTTQDTRDVAGQCSERAAELQWMHNSP